MSFTLKKPFVDSYNDMTPINDMVVVAPSDSTDLVGGPCRALCLTGAGTITFTTGAGNNITLTVSANWFGIQYIRASRILATGTTITAGNIIACY
jgi:hypothetical protein